MRTKAEIEGNITTGIGFTPEDLQIWTQSAVVELLFDIRDLLLAQTTRKNRRVLVEEVPLSEKEQTLINNLQTDE